MRNVLSEDDIGIVVFVAPTKALVNQVRAQVAKVSRGAHGNTFFRQLRSMMAAILDSDRTGRER